MTYRLLLLSSFLAFLFDKSGNVLAGFSFEPCRRFLRGGPQLFPADPRHQLSGGIFIYTALLLLGFRYFFIVFTHYITYNLHFLLRVRARARTYNAEPNFPPLFPRAHDSPVLSTLGLGFQFPGDLV